MPKLKKAARGKHRWIVFRIDNVTSRDELKHSLENNLESCKWRLFDILEGDKITFAILKTPLDNYQEVLLLINKSEKMSTITSSGKIRLARERLQSILDASPSDSV